ncbi:hypothetical protein Cgig2_031068 [Carnegiea gigantea]|uniref:Diacylglycerol O-acyltransferase n=1 Tax=Carnegiea gigantea TaxID=171969 RepID=A0A9Q1KAV7_9CARY|nr:hypothetical protein Cgig2_031068 [Carnegiea gigantea]
MEGVMRRKKGMIKPIEITTTTGEEQEKMEEEEEPLSPGSVIFHRPGFNIHILAIMGCMTPINLEVVKAKVPITLLKHPRFSSVVVGDPSKGEELRWVRTKVDLDKHIIVPEIDANKIESPDKFVEDYIYNLSKTTLDKTRPLWDVHILQLKTFNVEAEGIGIFRIHHSLGDGTSLISLLLALTRKISDPEAVPTIPVQKKPKKISKNDSPKRLFWRGVLAIWWVVKLLYNTMVDVMMFVATALFLKDTETPMKGGNGVALTPRRVVYKMVGLDDMKLVKNAMDATINDVALGITQAGVSRYLNRRSGVAVKNHGETLEKRNSLPKHIRIRSVLLINIRPSGGIQVLADLMEKNAEAKWGNSIGYVLLPFSIGLHDDPLDYIRKAKVTVDRKKHSLEALFTFSIAELVMKFVGTKVASALSHRVNSHTTMCFSNLVGPLEEIGFYGHPMAFLAPSCYGQPHALMINFQSYVNKMTIVLSVDEDAIPDPHQLCDDIAECLKLVKNAVISQGLVRGTGILTGSGSDAQLGQDVGTI